MKIFFWALFEVTVNSLTMALLLPSVARHLPILDVQDVLAFSCPVPGRVILGKQSESQPRSQGFSVRTREETRKPWSGPVTCLPNEIYKSSKQINSQKTSQSILFLCRAKFGTNQLKSMKTPSMFSKIYRYFWRFSTTGKAASKLHLGVSMQVVIHTKFPFSRLEQYGYCYN